jgi:peptidoglycan/xylan/chitin deacetylase (PgdA/CDA1 family)
MSSSAGKAGNSEHSQSRSLLRSLAAAAVALASRNRLLILTYHRVLAETDPLLPGEPTAETFGAQLDTLCASCTVLPLLEAVERIRTGTLPKSAISITFDDGYENNYSVALPVLNRFGVPATFFITTGYIGRGLMWNDKAIEALRRCAARTLDLRSLGLGVHAFGSDDERARAAEAVLTKLKYLSHSERDASVEAVAKLLGAKLADRLMLTAEEIRKLRAAGMGIGAHTVSHPILVSLGSADAEREIAGSKADLEEILGERVDTFAYPNGKPGSDYADEHVHAVRHSGFRAAVTTVRGYADASMDVLQLPRIGLWSMSKVRTNLQLMRAYWGA